MLKRDFSRMFFREAWLLFVVARRSAYPRLTKEFKRKGSEGDLDLGVSHSSPLWKGGSAVPKILNAFIEIKTPSYPKADG